MRRISDMHKKWMNEATYRTAYEVLKDEFVTSPARPKGTNPQSRLRRAKKSRR